jgi:hypothetical protein
LQPAGWSRPEDASRQRIPVLISGQIDRNSLEPKSGLENELRTDCRLADREDLQAILGLQDKNLVTKIAKSEMVHGFVTTPFDGQALEKLRSIDGLFVASREDVLVGYAVAAHWDYFRGRPMFDLMISRFENLHFGTTPILRENSYQYGPVCIEKSARGTGVLESLFAALNTHMSKRYAIGTTFINKINTRSYVAHTRKLGLQVIDEFEFSGNQFWGLAF